jgi:hypothetical protein
MSQVWKWRILTFIPNMLPIIQHCMCAGFQEARLVHGKPGIAFVDFSTDMQAGVAISGLQGFKLTPQHYMKVVYAKR